VEGVYEEKMKNMVEKNMNKWQKEEEEMEENNEHITGGEK
jgi:hypothetical protein